MAGLVKLFAHMFTVFSFFKMDVILHVFVYLANVAAGQCALLDAMCINHNVWILCSDVLSL